ncbi:MAG: hypothetical protein Ct9H300mP20_09520 [Gammaproteobacteria bacterium]|nr:MAG: hypothetical protein Ct9H300mP20_09520 [Gammaproteobacteria bacterium]
MTASKVGANVYLEKIPTFLSKSLSSEEMNKGDDYEILFTSDKTNKEKIEGISKQEKIPICEIGLIKKGMKCRLLPQKEIF